jgi:hypothetical protein
MYVNGDTLVARDCWNWLKDMVDEYGDGVLFCGDFNARAITWNRTGFNSQGIALEDRLDDTGLFCINDGGPTRMDMRPGDRDTAIELALVTHKDVLETK